MATGDDSIPPIDFNTFVLSLSTACMAQLGELEGPPGADVDLRMAEHTLEILQMLEAKTQGNLTGEEERILTQVLSDLREAFDARSAG